MDTPGSNPKHPRKMCTWISGRSVGVPEGKGLDPRPCRLCGAIFKPSRRWSLYCSPTCHENWWRALRSKARELNPKVQVLGSDKPKEVGELIQTSKEQQRVPLDAKALPKKAKEAKSGRIGRPPRFASPEELAIRAEEYFTHCEEEEDPVSISGLCVWLGVWREWLQEAMQKSPDWELVVRQIKQRVEYFYERRMLNPSTMTASIFCLKSLGWRDVQAVELQKEEKLVIEVVDYSNISLEPDTETALGRTCCLPSGEEEPLGTITGTPSVEH